MVKLSIFERITNRNEKNLKEANNLDIFSNIKDAQKFISIVENPIIGKRSVGNIMRYFWINGYLLFFKNHDENEDFRTFLFSQMNEKLNPKGYEEFNYGAIRKQPRNKDVVNFLIPKIKEIAKRDLKLNVFSWFKGMKDDDYSDKKDKEKFNRSVQSDLDLLKDMSEKYKEKYKNEKIFNLYSNLIIEIQNFSKFK